MFQDLDFQSSSFRVYTTLDMDLQRAAMEAVRAGMPLIDEQLKKQRRFRGRRFPDAQVALVAIDPHTGQVKSADRGAELRHQPAQPRAGQAAAGLHFQAVRLRHRARYGGGGRPPHPDRRHTVVDQPTTFWYDGKPYEPSNFKHEFHGTVTLRQALAKSMNVATVKVAEMVGYDNIVEVASAGGVELRHSSHAGSGAGRVRRHTP